MSFSSDGSPSPAPTPRPSASLIIINARNEILLVRRNPKATAFGGMHVRVYLFTVRVQEPFDNGVRFFQEGTLTGNKTSHSL